MGSSEVVGYFSHVRASVLLSVVAVVVVSSGR
jgi:hypothetical protein